MTPHAEPITPADWLDEVRRYSQEGEFFRAYDAAMRGHAAFPDEHRLAHRAVLCLANAGALRLARQRYAELGLGRIADPECIALDARLLKSEAFVHPEPLRGDLLRAATARYEAAYARALADGSSRAYYPGINVAALRSLCGDDAGAHRLARSLRDDLVAQLDADLPTSRSDVYWRLATLIEANVILGDLAEARRWVPRALVAGGERYDELASTARQLRRLLASRDEDLGWLGDLAPPVVVHYCGHIIAGPDRGGRIAADDEPALARRIDAQLAGLRIGFAYGSLAAGADILFAEALLKARVTLNVVLPFAIDDFIALSVAPSGPAWVERFTRCLAAAATVRYATEDRHLGDDNLYAYGSQLAMGLAVLCGRHLCAETRQIAVWDGHSSTAVAGTAHDVAVWRRTGLAQDIVTFGAAPLTANFPGSVAAAPAQSSVGRGTRAMLFGDIKGFSKLNDAQIPAFSHCVFGALGRVIDRYRPQTSMVNTWGDGLFLVFEEAAAAARCALDLQVAMLEVDLDAAGLPATLALRLGGHLGPVYCIDDPILHRWNFMGAHVSRAARIEPITPEGCVYVTETFAAVLALDCGDEFACDYVGITEAAKSYGPMRMFLLHPVGDAPDGPATLRAMP